MATVQWYTYLTQKDGAEITELLIGRRVTKVADDKLTLDDGTVLTLTGHDGGCGCSAGCYDLTELNGIDNVITNVELVNDPSEDGYKGEGYKIFVFAGLDKVNLATFEGSDGNGYYGTGYSIRIERPAAGA